jgi:S1-C subfamily serine protease
MHWLLVPFLALWALINPPGTPYSRMVDRVSASVVRVTDADDTYVCSGFVIAPQRVLTANHCLDGETILADGITAKILHHDTYYDLGVLEVKINKPALLFRDYEVERFEKFTAIGYAFGWTRLSAKEERVENVNLSPKNELPPGLIVQNGYIGGMSGGPLVDDNGYLVGIMQQTNDGVGYGVGVLLIRAFLLGIE